MGASRCRQTLRIARDRRGSALGVHVDRVKTERVGGWSNQAPPLPPNCVFQKLKRTLEGAPGVEKKLLGGSVSCGAGHPPPPPPAGALSHLKPLVRGRGSGVGRIARVWRRGSGVGRVARVRGRGSWMGGIARVWCHSSGVGSRSVVMVESGHLLPVPDGQEKSC